MKKLLLTGVAFAALIAGSAMAADVGVPVRRAYVAPVLAAPSWTGCYIGINGGYGWGTGDQTAGFGDPTFTDPFSTGGGMPGTLAAVSMKGGVFGGHLGCNYQLSNLVLGVEVSDAWTDLNGGTTMGLSFPSGTTSTVTWNTKLKWLATATPRVGIAWNQLLFYGKAGLAAGSVDASAAQITGTQGAFSATQQRTGWTAGVGVEYALTSNLILGVEYDYVDLRTQNYAGWGIRTNGAGRFFSEDVKLNFSEVLARISYKFGYAAAPAVYK